MHCSNDIVIKKISLIKNETSIKNEVKSMRDDRLGVFVWLKLWICICINGSIFEMLKLYNTRKLRGPKAESIILKVIIIHLLGKQKLHYICKWFVILKPFLKHQYVIY